MIFLYEPKDVWNCFLNMPNVKKYSPDSIIAETDLILVPIYLHLSALESLSMSNGDPRYFNWAMRNVDEQENANPILTASIKKILEGKNRFLILYNSWETRDLITNFYSVREFVKDYLKLPRGKVFFSTSCYLSHMQYKKNGIIPLDWPYLLAKKNFTKDEIVPYNSKKKYRIMCLNRRSSYERYLYCLYLYTKYKNKTKFSFLGGIGPLKEEDKKKYNLTLGDSVLLNRNLPMVLDSKNPRWTQVKTLKKYFKQSYIYVTFETNAQPYSSPTQQVSEKTYKGLRVGKPFIIFTTRGGILKHLRDLGFKTFSPFINENYDDKSLSYEKRYELLMMETDRLCSMEEKEMEDNYLKMEEIVKHNTEVLKNKNNVPNFFHTIKRIFNLF